MKKRILITLAVVFATAAIAQTTAPLGPGSGGGSGGGGGGGGTPCTTTSSSIQYDASGAFGCVSGATSNGTAITFANGDLVLSGSSSGSATLEAPSTGGGTVTLPAGTVTLAPTASPTFSGTVTMPDSGTWGASGISYGSMPLFTKAMNTVAAQSAFGGL